MTVVNATGQIGYMTIYPESVAQPLAANMIYFSNPMLSYAFVVKLNAGTGEIPHLCRTDRWTPSWMCPASLRRKDIISAFSKSATAYSIEHAFALFSFFAD